jgi:hypothetical protein
MGYRRFSDREGETWEVKDRSRSEWEFVPVSRTSGKPLQVPAPGYEGDPFELSVEELQRMLETAQAAQARRGQKKSPFGD